MFNIGGPEPLNRIDLASIVSDCMSDVMKGRLPTELVCDGERVKGAGEVYAEGEAARHVSTPPLNTEFNSVFRQRLKMRLAPKFTPIYLILGVLREL